MNYGRLPFWYDFNLSPATIGAALALTVIGAVVAGVMPARKITRGIGTRLRAGTAGGGGVSFGGVWTAVIVVQVALTVMIPAVAMLVRGERERIAAYDFGFRAHEYLGVTLGFDTPADTPTPETGAALSAFGEALRQRLEVEPGVAGVTFVDRLPGDYHAARRLEVVSLPGNPASTVRTARIHPSYFDVLEAPMLAGRAFTNADLSPDARVVIVDQGFANHVLPGRNVIGHRVRLSSGQTPDSNMAQLPSYEIVGVAKELGMSHVVQRKQPIGGVYLPFVPGTQGPLSMIVHTRGDPVSIAPRVRELATAVDPALRVEQMTAIDQTAAPELWFFGLWMRLIIGLTGVALLLSLSGIYAVLSYIVARRTREIGVRVALGASARRVIISIFRRPLTQVTLGVMAGAVLIAAATSAFERTQGFGGIETLGDVALLIGYAVLMLGVCMLACVVPTVRALRVQPTEALRAE